jgi:hypothetical protein
VPRALAAAASVALVVRATVRPAARAPVSAAPTVAAWASRRSRAQPCGLDGAAAAPVARDVVGWAARAGRRNAAAAVAAITAVAVASAAVGLAGSTVAAWPRLRPARREEFPAGTAVGGLFRRGCPVAPATGRRAAAAWRVAAAIRRAVAAAWWAAGASRPVVAVAAAWRAVAASRWAAAAKHSVVAVGASRAAAAASRPAVAARQADWASRRVVAAASRVVRARRAAGACLPVERAHRAAAASRRVAPAACPVAAYPVARASRRLGPAARSRPGETSRWPAAGIADRCRAGSAVEAGNRSYCTGMYSWMDRRTGAMVLFVRPKGTVPFLHKNRDSPRGFYFTATLALV